MYRCYRSVLSLLGAEGTECFTISRGYNQPPITACNGKLHGNSDMLFHCVYTGLGDAPYFYVWWIFAFNGLFASLLFLLATYLR